jgi:hypothetical protein
MLLQTSHSPLAITTETLCPSIADEKHTVTSRQHINRDDESSVGGGVGRFFFQSPGGLQIGRGLATREIQRGKHVERLFFGCGGAELLE